jgi:transcriptional antiterminator RfaH
MHSSDPNYKWHVLYVRHQHEIKVNAFLKLKGIRSYLPLERKLRFWSNRQKWIEVPLFPCYIFVNVSVLEYYDVFEHQSVIKYVRSGGKTCVIPDEEIDSIKKIINSDLDYSVQDSLVKTGEKVHIKNGPLKNFSGEVLRKSKSNRLVLRIENIGYSLLINAPYDIISA